jgi:hypothetical protein
MASILDPTQPLGPSGAGRGDDELRALKQYLVDVFGLPVAPNQLITPAFSIDVNGKVTFTSPPSGLRSLPGVVGFVGINNSVTPLTKFDLSAKHAAVKQASDESVIGLPSNPSVTVDTALVGPVANGRDQAVGFSISSWIHFHFIYNLSTAAVAGIASLSATAPVLPTGYTHSVYVTSVFKDSTGNLKQVRCRGSWVWYQTAVVALSGGTQGAAAEANIPLTLIVPTNCQNAEMMTTITSTGVTVNGFDQLRLRVVSGIDWINGVIIYGNSTLPDSARDAVMMPVIGQNIWYYILRGSTGGTVSVNIDVMGYEVPNGD